MELEPTLAILKNSLNLSHTQNYATIPEDEPLLDAEFSAPTKNSGTVGLLQRNLWIRFSYLLAFKCFSSCSYSLFAPFFPVAAAEKGMSASQVGLLFGFYELVVGITLPLCGNFVSELGPRFLTLGGSILAGGPTLLMGVLEWCPAGAPFIVLCYIIRFLQAVSSSMLQAAVFAIGTTWFNRETATVFGLTEGASAVGQMLGASIGGVFYDIGGFSLPFFVMGALFLLFGFPSLLVIPKDLKCPPRKRGKNMTQLLLIPQMWLLMYSMFCAAIVYLFQQPTLTLHLNDLGVDSYSFISVLFLAAPACYGVTAIILSRLTDRITWDRMYIVLVGTILTVVGSMFIGPAPFFPFIKGSVALTVVNYMLIGIGIACMKAPIPSEMLEVAIEGGMPQDMNTNAMIGGLYGGSYYFGGFLGPSIASPMVDWWGYEWGTAIIGIVMLTTTATTLVRIIMKRRAIKRIEYRDGVLASVTATLQISKRHLYCSVEGSMFCSDMCCGDSIPATVLTYSEREQT